MLHPCLALLLSVSWSPVDAGKLAEAYAAAVESVNRAQAEKPTAKSEEELAQRLPPAAIKALGELLKAPDAPDTRAALARCAEAALDLDRVQDFEALRTRLELLAPAQAKPLGIALSRQRFLALGRGGMEPTGLKAVADAFDLVLDGYGELFGLTGFSKLPGKKLRLLVHLEPEITRPPHFAPEFPYHSLIDFPVIEAGALHSPTKDGKFLFYGLCHELGHVLAMWGDTKNEEDHHSWAHYTGVALVEHLTKTKKDDPALKELRDVRWRSLDAERKELAGKQVKPGLQDSDSVLELFVTLHDSVGPKAIGEALEALEASGKLQRVNRVRYYRMADLRDALLATKAGKLHKQELEAAFGGK